MRYFTKEQLFDVAQELITENITLRHSNIELRKDINDIVSKYPEILKRETTVENQMS